MVVRTHLRPETLLVHDSLCFFKPRAQLIVRLLVLVKQELRGPRLSLVCVPTPVVHDKVEQVLDALL